MGDGDSKCERIAREQVGVITRPQLEELGLNAMTMHRRVKRGDWLATPFPGIAILRHLHVTWMSDVSAVVLASHGAAYGPTGAAVWRLDGFDEYIGKIQVITSSNCRYADDSFVLTRANWINQETDVTTRNHVRVLQPWLALASLGEWASVDDVEGAMDHVLRLKWSTWDELERTASATRHRFPTGAAILRHLISERAPQRQHTDSLLETKAIQILRNNGLPKPILQYEVFDGSRRVAAADLAYPEHRVLIETVGVKAHRSELAQYSRDCRRDNRVCVIDNHYKVLRYTWEQITKTPDELVKDVMRALGIPRQADMEVRDRPGGRPILLPNDL